MKSVSNKWKLSKKTLNATKGLKEKNSPQTATPSSGPSHLLLPRDYASIELLSEITRDY